MSWYRGPLCSWDTETTGTDPETARIVSCAAILVGGDQPRRDRTWLTDAGGEEIPEGAAAVHGITTARARAEGQPIAEAVKEIAVLLAEQVQAGVPLIVMNARYDFTVLDRELARLGLPSLAEQAGREPLVIDPLVLDKKADPYRKGSRKLADMAAHYGVPLGADAHNAGADALAAARIAYRIAVQRPRVQETSLELLHDLQISWAEEQAASLQSYFRKKDPTAVVEGAWPMIPRQQVAE